MFHEDFWIYRKIKQTPQFSQELANFHNCRKNLFWVFLNASYYISRHLKALSISLLNLKVIFNVMTLFVQPS